MKIVAICGAGIGTSGILKVNAERVLLRLGLESARAFPAFCDAIAERSGHDPGYRRSGTLVVARDRDDG